VRLAEHLLKPAPTQSLAFAGRACELSWPTGCSMAATMLAGGYGVPPDPARAAELRRRYDEIVRGSRDAEPPSLAPSIVEARRIRGEPQIVPPDVVKIVMVQRKRRQLVASVKLCLDVAGVPSSLTMLKSSGYRDYDRHIRETMQAWRYSPFTVDGAPAPVCTAVTFVYSQRAPAVTP
jgi:TonB family protein